MRLRNVAANRFPALWAFQVRFKLFCHRNKYTARFYCLGGCYDSTNKRLHQSGDLAKGCAARNAGKMLQKYSVLKGDHLFMDSKCFQFRSASTSPYYTFPLIVGMQDLLVSIQEFTGLPWWGTIMTTTFVFRLLITLPLAREQAKTVAKLELLQPTVNEIIEALKHNITIKGKRTGKPVEEVNREFRMEARLHLRDIYKRENCHPFKLYLLPWVQLPLWILISLALRNLSGFFPKDLSTTDLLCHPSLTTGGFGWITDLSVSDPSFILPAIIGISNLINIELNSLRKKEPSKRQVIITRIFRTLTVAMMFFASQVPTAMSLYWATSSTYGLAQNLLLMQPVVRRKLKIPKAPSESDTPIQDKLTILKTKLNIFMEIQRK